MDLITRIRPGAATATDLEGMAGHPASAVKAYLVAKEAMRRGDVDRAEAAIDSAVAADTTFAMAIVEAVEIKSWAQSMRGQPYTGLFQLVARAAPYADSLPPRIRLRLEATRASIRTNGAAAASATRQILSRDSTDIEAWMNLAYYHRAYGWQYGATDDEALRAFDRAIALDSTLVPALVGALLLLDHLADPRASGYAELLARADTTSVLARGTLLGHRALMLDDGAFPPFADTLALQHPVVFTPALRALRTVRPDRAELLMTALLPRQGPGIPDYRGEWARHLAAQGRYRTLDSAVQAGGFPMQTLPRWFLVAPALAAIGDSARAAVAAGFLGDFIPPDSALAWFRRMPVWLNGWMVGAYHAMYGDSAVARRWQAVVGTLPAGGRDDYRGAIQADLEARLLARRGDLEAALTAASRAYEAWGIHTENVLEFHPEPAMRFHCPPPDLHGDFRAPRPR